MPIVTHPVPSAGGMHPRPHPVLPGMRADQPMLETPRLLLRPFCLDDAGDVRRLAGDFEIADTTLTIPHPYPEGAAEAWIAHAAHEWERGAAAVFALTLRDSGEVAGAVGLEVTLDHHRAELGYWVGKAFWGRGLATDGARAAAAFAFEGLGLERVTAHHMTRNPASGAVLRKLGMRHEGTLRRHVRKWDALEDVAVYGLLRGELRAG